MRFICPEPTLEAAQPGASAGWAARPEPRNAARELGALLTRALPRSATADFFAYGGRHHARWKRRRPGLCDAFRGDADAKAWGFPVADQIASADSLKCAAITNGWVRCVTRCRMTLTAWSIRSTACNCSAVRFHRSGAALGCRS